MGSQKRDPPRPSDTALNPVPEPEPEVRTDATVERPSLFPSETALTALPTVGRPQDTVIGALDIPPPESQTSLTPTPGELDQTNPQRSIHELRDAALGQKTNADRTDPARANPTGSPVDLGTQPGIPQMQTQIGPAIDLPPRSRSGRQRAAPAPVAPVTSGEITVPPEQPTVPPLASSGGLPQDTGFIRALRRRRGERERPHGMPAWAPDWAIPFFELPRETQLILTGGSGAVLITLILIVVTTKAPKAPKHLDLSADPKIGRMYAEAKEAVLEHHYDEAVAALEAIRQIQPDNEEATDYLAFAKKERDAQSLLDRAKRELEGQRFDEARTVLKQIPDDSESAQASAALLQQVNAAQARSLFDAAEASLKGGQVDSARTSLEPLAKLDPALSQQLARDLAAAPAPRPGGSTPAPRRNSAIVEDAAVQSELAPAFQAFNDDPTHAADLFDQLGRSSRSAVVKKRAPVLASSARACGRSRAAAGSGGDPTLLQAAYEHCSEVVAEGPLATDLRQRTLVAYGRQADDAKASGKKAVAAHAYRALLSFNPGDAHARRELDGLIDEAHTMYMNAYVLCDSDPEEAGRRLREVVDILVPGDADYAKAKERLERLGTH